MGVITFNADATSLTLNGTGIVDFIEGDILELAPVNPLTTHQNGSDGAVNITKRVDGGVHDLTVRVTKYSDADIFLNARLNESSLVVFNGSLKENFNKDGSDGMESWLLENGSFTDRPKSTKNNQAGNSTMEYKIRFRDCTRNI